MKKNILKGILTAAMMATIFIGAGSSAKACWEDEYSILPNGECVCGECYTDETGLTDADGGDAYSNWMLMKAGYTKEESEAILKNLESALTTAVYGESNPDIKSHTNLLTLVNKDRNANGAGNLVWNADLEAVARQRAYEVYLNTQSAEYVNALNSCDYAKQCELIHAGSREDIRENAIVSLYSGVAEKTANENWITSEGHHVVRINAGYTQYACASYTDLLTGVETWVEMFQ